MHRRYYTLQAMHKVAEHAQSQVSVPAGEQCQHCTFTEAAYILYAVAVMSGHALCDIPLHMHYTIPCCRLSPAQLVL